MRVFIIIFIVAFVLAPASDAQNKREAKSGKQYTLKSEKLDKQGKELDSQILDLNSKIASVIKKFDLLNTPGIRILPYQTSYVLGKNFIEMEKHLFIKDALYNRKIAGIKKKRIKITISGQTVSRIESTIFEKDFDSGRVNEVIIIDPSPLSSGTDDITFTHNYVGKQVVKNKKMGDIKNTTANPVRNEIKREFLIPHLTIFYNSLLFIAGSYYKSLKDTDSSMSEFLRKSTILILSFISLVKVQGYIAASVTGDRISPIKKVDTKPALITLCPYKKQVKNMIKSVNQLEQNLHLN
jgi:hypothetical protein